jgi:hypothetical protein
MLKGAVKNCFVICCNACICALMYMGENLFAKVQTLALASSLFNTFMD